MGVEKFTQPEAEVDKLASLKLDSLDISNLALTGKGGFDASYQNGGEPLKIQPGTWNENSGVIVYADKGGKIYAVPASEEVRRQLQDPESGMEKDEGVSVPHMNEADVWGTEERRKQMPIFDRWKGLVRLSLEKEKAIAERQAAEAREIFGGQSGK